jgi:TolB-like protein
MTAQIEIFLSYNREDQARAKLFADAFAAEGLYVWWDTALRSGEAYDEVTEAALRRAKAVVVLWSPRSVVSRWVRAEATVADRCKTLVPVTIEPCERPIMFELTQTADLSHWRGDVSDKAWLTFLDDVRRMAAKAAASSPETVTQTVTPPTIAETLKPGQSGSAPSLAVLPFTNRSQLPEDDIFAEGMVEDVISALTQGVNVRVLGSMSTAHLRKSTTADLSTVGRDLGVRYLLEGNVRRVGFNLRVTTQLLESESGAAVWSGKFDRPLEELAELQEELVTEIAGVLETQVYSLEIERALKKPGDITAWEAIARAWSAYRKWDTAARVEYIEEALRAIAIAPDYAPGHALLANGLANHYLVSPHDPAEVQRICATAERALVLAPDDALVLGSVGVAFSFVGLPDEGTRYTVRAARKAPGSGILRWQHGITCVMVNRHEDALSHLKTAERLMPGSQLIWLVKHWQSRALAELGRWDEADATNNECVSHNPIDGLSYVFKALSATQLGQEADARKSIRTAQRLGCELVQAMRFWQRTGLNSPTLEADIAIMRALYADSEPTA